MDRHADVADVEQYYMRNGCFWCLFDNEVLIGTVAVRIIDIDNKVVELKRMFILPECQGKGYGRLLLEYAIDYAREQQQGQRQRLQRHHRYYRQPCHPLYLRHEPAGLPLVCHRHPAGISCSAIPRAVRGLYSTSPVPCGIVRFAKEQSISQTKSECADFP